jgi:uncharacterized protein
MPNRTHEQSENREHDAMTFVDVSAATREVVETFYRRLAAGEPDAIAELFAEEIDWFIPGDEALAPWLGRRSTRKEVSDFFRLLFANVDPIRAEIQHVLVDGDTAITTGEFASRMRKTGKVFASIFFAHFTVRGGVIVGYRLLEDSHGLVVALTG